MSGKSTKSTNTCGRLLLLATTDLHMQLLGYDYFADRANDRIGLLPLSARIAALRADDTVTTLLFDNGDLLQGNPLADHLAETLTPAQIHPMIAALNLLGYDAMTLGNHDFDYGLPFLQQVLAEANAPVVCANVATPGRTALAQPFAVLHRHIRCADGRSRPIRIGVTGFAPPQITDSDPRQQGGEIAVTDIITAARAVLPRMRRAGAEVIVALAHSGIGAHDHQNRMENAVVPLAAIDGINVIVAGHTHDQFPDHARDVAPPVDPVAGTVHGKPTVLAGAYGKALGVIDLTLAHGDAGWTIVGQQCRLEVQPERPKDGPLQQELRALVLRSHTDTLQHIRQPIAQTPAIIHSYLATVAPDLPQQILGQAMIRAAQDGLKGAQADTPVLAATSPFRYGGQSGLGQYLAIAPGPITLHDAAAIFPFNDRLWAVRRSGAQIIDWLERAASHYNQITPGSTGAALINPHSAGYTCDTLHGLRYQIDLSAPPRFAPSGALLDADATRIVSVEHQGDPLRPDAQFIIATNSFRATGGGGYPPVPAKDLLALPVMKIRDVLIDTLRKDGAPDVEIAPNWRFAPRPGTSATFTSTPAAEAHLPPNMRMLGTISDAEARFEIRF